ncbi:hypothetical protein [Streptomyces sp. NBC_00038]|uniref:hypothetical protein n=1 Tax=Streptomyces sp. NBC_00038 TaxID=2903615 RepID=UPI0022533B7F|nr:hypothetical protein [Streptomyces sp. NBC_00038]MCX5557703.1 hypothetical protein [Streptomyces sp. NBC_00038]
MSPVRALNFTVKSTEDVQQTSSRRPVDVTEDAGEDDFEDLAQGLRDGGEKFPGSYRIALVVMAYDD